jgi:hypothetical protein
MEGATEGIKEGYAARDWNVAGDYFWQVHENKRLIGNVIEM